MADKTMKNTDTMQFNITGMSCAACQARVEKAANAVAGVDSCAVSLLTNSMSVSGNAQPESIIKAIEAAGYGASLKLANVDLSAEEHREISALKKRLFTSIGFLVVLMYISMGHNMASFPVPAFLEIPVVCAWVQAALAVTILVINRKFFTNGFGSLFHMSPNMDTLVALGSTAAFVYSMVETVILSADTAGAALAVSASGLYADSAYAGAQAAAVGASETALHYLHNLYFEASAMIPCLITVGKLLEAISKGRTTDALKDLMKLAPSSAVVRRGGTEVSIPIEEVRCGDICLIKPGEKIPVDGVVIAGSSAVNEAFLTGESIPVDKAEGDRVSAASINLNGFLEVRTEQVGDDTALARIIKLVSDSAATKAPIARIADKVSLIFVPTVMGIAAVTFIIWMIAGRDITFSIARAVSVLVISCPCALGLATPVAIMAGSGVGARNGILFKTAASLEMAGKCAAVALDKTGTITEGHPFVTDIAGQDKNVQPAVTGLLQAALSVEMHSEHPIAKAIVEYASEKAEPLEVTGFRALAGNGVSAQTIRGLIMAGSVKFMETQPGGIPKCLKKAAETFAGQGKTPILVSVSGICLGVIAVADRIKEDSACAIRELEGMGIHTVMLTGDNRNAAGYVAGSAGVAEVVAEVLPDEKNQVVRRLMASSVTAMVGDGINDAPALTAADVGIAIGTGADVAIDAADIVVVKSSLRDVAAAIRLSRRTITNIHENLFWAFFYNIICIPLAAGFYQAIFGWTWEMNPMIGAACMCISSFTVCMNALRLNLVKIYDSSHDRKLSSGRRSAHLASNAAGGESTAGKCDYEAMSQGERTGNAEVTGTPEKAGKCEANDLSDEKYVLKKVSPEIDNTTDNEYKEDILMTKTIMIEGMMCPHCEATVKKALEAIDGVESAEVSHVQKTAIVTLTRDVADAEFEKAITEKDFKYIGVK